MDEQDPLLDKAVAALREGDFETSFVITQALAHEGDPLAQHFLGWHYHKGVGVSADDAQAVAWWLKAAGGGIPESMQGLGWAYEQGRGVAQDLERAYVWYTRAAAGGDETARESLGELSPRLTAAQIKRAEREAGQPPAAD